MAISTAFAVLVYFFGMKIGPPFSWLVEDYVGIGISDAFFWLLIVFLLLKIGEILILGRDEEEAARIEAQEENEFVGIHVQTETMSGLRDVGIELVRNFWTSYGGRSPKHACRELYRGCAGYSSGRSNPERAAQQSW